ncbi:MAG: tetratricopeptide repeat protein [Rikenellaceae bacterium]
MFKEKKCLLVLLLICFYTNNASAQWLEAKSEKDERSVSIKTKDGVPSSRIIVSSSLPLNYSSNMGDVTNETVGFGFVNGLNTDTIYFYLVDDFKRTLTISADGYPPISVPFVLLPKETYRCLVYDPSKVNEEEESSNNVNTVNWQFKMAQNFDFGLDGFMEDQIEALNWYTKAAEQGHGLSQSTLGVKYASGGNGFDKDLVKSARWFLIAAQQNYDTAQFAIANCFLHGNGVKQDLGKAYYWFQESASKGIDEARYKMADMLLNGYGYDNDVDNLLEWFRFFADENRSDAQYTYSKLLLGRKASSTNEAIAIDYLNKAIALSNTDAMVYLAERCFNSDLSQYNVVKGMELLQTAANLNNIEAKSLLTKYQQTLSREEVYTYTKRFAENGDSNYMLDLANMYYAGDGTKLNYEKAFEFFSKASEYNITDAYTGLGICYYYGFGVPTNYNEAFKNLSKGSEGGKSEAISALGLCYFYGHGVTQDYNKAYELFTKSDNGNNDIATNGLGMCHYFGQPITTNTSMAISLFEKALETEHYHSAYNLGNYYQNLINDLVKATNYYTLSAEAENPEAQNKLGLILFNQGIIKEFNKVSKTVTDTVIVVSNEEIIRNSLSWLKASNERNYLIGGYNYAYALMCATNSNSPIAESRAQESIEVFRSLAEKGSQDAMIALAYYYKFNLGIDVTEAYKWSKKAAEDDSGSTTKNAMYKGLLGCFEFDEAQAIANATNMSVNEIQQLGAKNMADAANQGCPFVFDRLYTYERDINDDKKTAKIWSKQGDLIPDNLKLIPKLVDFK